MIREKITHKDFHRIAKEHEYFLWHFIQKEQDKSPITLGSILEGNKEKNPLKFLMDGLDIPYYESYTEESIDFLMGLGYKYKNLYHTRITETIVNRNHRFSPVLIGFKRFTNVLSTQEKCYCLEGVVDIIHELNPKYMEQIMENIEKNPD